MPAGRSYERRLRAKRDAERQARRRAERMRKLRVGGSIAGALAVAVVLLILFLGKGGSKPAAQTPTPTPSPTFTPVAGCTAPTPAPAPNGKQFKAAPKMTIDRKKKYVATFQTSCGTVKMALDVKDSPATANNFVFLAKQGFFDGTKIPRVQNDPGFGIVQAGSQTGTISGGPGYSYKGEYPPKGVKYTRGVVAMANSGDPSSDGSQFFFVVTGATPLDAQPKYTILGKVSDAPSLAALDRILIASGPPVDPTQQQQLGITPEPGIYILKVTITEQK